jgi:hypothetical protein
VSFGTCRGAVENTHQKAKNRALQLTFGDQIKLFLAKNNKNRRTRETVPFSEEAANAELTD